MAEHEAEYFDLKAHGAPGSQQIASVLQKRQADGWEPVMSYVNADFLHIIFRESDEVVKPDKLMGMSIEDLGLDEETLRFLRSLEPSVKFVSDLVLRSEADLLHRGSHASWPTAKTERVILDIRGKLGIYRLSLRQD